MNQQVRTVMEILQSTPAVQIPDLDFVKKKFIQNYNLCNPQPLGELMFERQNIYFKQAIARNQKLGECDPFTLYAAFITSGVLGCSFDPDDNELYLIPEKGKAKIQRQAGVHVKRLKKSGQILAADQATLVYQGDTYIVKNGRVLEHTENFKSDIIIAGYVRFILDDTGRDVYYTYRKSDWEAWKKKSSSNESFTNQYGKWVDVPWDSNNGQPDPGFLKTKITLHATKEKTWATGSTPANVDTFPGIFTEDIEHEDMPADDGTNSTSTAVATTNSNQSNNTMQGGQDNRNMVDESDFGKTEDKKVDTITHDDEDF